MIIKKNEYLDKKIYSQSGQDAFLLKYFNNKKNGTFIDIGANNGILFSNTYYLEKELEWDGICIEPIPNSFKQLEKNRNCINLMIGISDKNKIEKFNFIENTKYTLSGIIKEFDPRHLERIKKTSKKLNKKIIEIDIKCRLLNDILEEYKIYNIDYLNIDTEGNEMKIINTIDFKKYNIKLMSVENNFNEKKQINDIMSKGYNFLGKIGADDIFEKINK